MKFIIATHNKNKIKELGRILAPLGIKALSQDEAGIELADVEETGSTFEENSRLKAFSAFSAVKNIGLGAIADDSGLSVDALGGAPGVYSARYSGFHGNDSENINLLLKNMKDVPEAERGASFVCTICCIMPDGSELAVRGECRGKIGYKPVGEGGFGYDPVFMLPDGRSFAQLSGAEKDSISHRGNALRKLSDILSEKKEKLNNDDK